MRVWLVIGRRGLRDCLDVIIACVRSWSAFPSVVDAHCFWCCSCVGCCMSVCCTFLNVPMRVVIVCVPCCLIAVFNCSRVC